ncbi:Gfo/Idh/MocA family oxidoreductase [Brenneria izadpanahii]|uniref:Gfo/Idh/MocA family oxidoreductase n=1 Tax=Brenneria izadpanahii TaxID=2722756 RepID=A0ABX7UQR9_9GAMM|nr:Gfo/Idh/MocA family oxidoreductase [Brenneria izadpanahii]QTF07991.1 Gfo/Idh/MocA family oxidoreductase [Brenneria izadpanahii]
MSVTTTRPKLKLGFIGGGINSAIGMTHKIACQMDGHFELAAGCFSRNREINRLTAESWGVAPERAYNSIDDFLRAEKAILDAVVVLTPTPTHTDIVIACLEQGLTVICEKSLAASVEDIESINRTLISTQGQLMVTFNYTGYPMIRELRQRIADGELGAISQIMIEMPQEGFLRHTSLGQVSKPQSWRQTDGKIPTVSLDLGVHVHQIVHFLIGEKALDVYAASSAFGEVTNVIDTVNCIAHYTGGVVCNYWYGKAALGYRNGLRIRIFGSKGAAEWLQMDPEILHMSDVNGGSWIVDRTHPKNRVANQTRYCRFKAGHPAGFIEAFANYYEDIASVLKGEHNKMVFGLNVAYEGLRFLHCANESSITHERVIIGSE